MTRAGKWLVTILCGGSVAAVAIFTFARVRQAPVSSLASVVVPGATVSPSPTPPPWVGSVLAAVVPDGRGQAIALYEVGGDGPAALLVDGFDAIGRIAWSPDDAHLAFAGLRDGNWDVFRIARDGADLQRLTDDPAYDASPCWSPDGRQIAFNSYRDGNLDVYRLAVDGAAHGPVERVTFSDGPAIEPSWSPDGGWIAFAGWSDGAYRVEAVSVTGGEHVVVEEDDTGTDLRAPSWSPDGAAITYVERRYGPGRLLERTWSPEVLEVDPGDTPDRASTLAMRADAYDWYPEGGAVASVTDERGRRLVQVSDGHGVGGRRAAVLPLGAGHVSWSRGPMPAGLAEAPPGATVQADAMSDGGAAVSASGPSAQPRGTVPPSPLSGTPSLVAPSLIAPIPTTTMTWPARVQTPSLPSGSLVGPAGPIPTADAIARPGFVVLSDVDAPGPRIQADLAGDFATMRAEVRTSVGADFLGTLADLWRPLGYDGSSFFSWHKTGRAFDTQMELFGPGGRRDMVLVREEVRGRTEWRMFLRAVVQDGSVGKPLFEPGWTFAAGSGDPELTAEGGRRGNRVPEGYWLDFTAVAERYGWVRIPSNTGGDLDWHSHWIGIDYWHYERRDGLRWFDAVRQVYSDDELTAELRADRLRERGVSVNRLPRLGFPSGWLSEG